MKKLKVLSKKVEGFNLKLTLTQTDGCLNHGPVYGLIGETDDDVCIIPEIGTDLKFANKIFEKLFHHDVMPCTLQDIIEDSVVRYN